MPTVYTAGIEDGEITTLKEFAQLCARNFDFTMHMRDDPLDSPLRDPEPTQYYIDYLTEVQRELDLAEDMPDEFWEAKAEADYAKRSSEARESYKRRKEIYDRYVNMRIQVQNWSVPEQLENLKNFMLQQIETCMDNPDERNPHNDAFYHPRKLDGPNFKRDYLERLLRKHQIAVENVERDRKRVEEVRAYLLALRISLA